MRSSKFFFIHGFTVCFVFLFCFSPAASAATYYVPDDYSTIQTAIDAADANSLDTVVVRPGTYYETLEFNGKDLILTSTDLEDPNATIIDGNIDGSVITFSGDETSACELRGFVITNGYGGDGWKIDGNEAQVTISHCVIIGNRDGYGVSECDGSITNCTITGNSYGLRQCDGSITNCTIADSGSIGLYGCGGSITNCTITDNGDGGLYGYGGSIINCTITDNGDHGVYKCDGSITNCVIVGNRRDGLRQCDGSITNCIIWGNIGSQVYDCSVPTYSCIQDWSLGGTGNMSDDPRLTDVISDDSDDWDLHVLPGSPCIDAGTNTPPAGLMETDMEGTQRPLDGDGDGTVVSDIGAFEFFYDPNSSYLYVSPESFTFAAYEAAADPNDQILTIQNLAGGTLNWSIDLTDQPDWLTISPTGGSLGNGESDDVTLSVDITGLSDGQYSYSFEVSDPSADNSLQTVTVDLEVIGSILAVSSNMFTLVGYEGGTDPNDWILTIQNAGGGTLNWSIDLTDQPDWLTISPTGGSLESAESEMVTLSVDITDLSNDRYSYSFEVSSPSAVNSPQTVMVDLRARGTIYYVPDDYSTIQAAINATVGDANYLPLETIVISPGTYSENLNFYGRDIVLTSTNPDDPNVVAATVIDGGSRSDYTVRFDTGRSDEDVFDEWVGAEVKGLTITNGGVFGLKGCLGLTQCVISDALKGYYYYYGVFHCSGPVTNCTITGNLYGMVGCDGSITGCTIANNLSNGLGACYGSISNCVIYGNGIDGIWYCRASISNCIIWNNGDDQVVGSTKPAYSCIQDWTGGGMGNIAVDPLFADPDNGDFHLKSESGRWDSAAHEWVVDVVTSPCIDAGDSAFDTWQNELWPHGEQVNMGAYGGTPQASMSSNSVGSVADLDHDGQVEMTDLELFVADWLFVDYLLDTDLDLDGRVDLDDFALFADEWLWRQPSILTLSETDFSWSASEGADSPNSSTLTVSNVGLKILNWSIDDGEKPDWLTISPTAGCLEYEKSETVTLSVDITGLSRGQYNYSFEISDPNSQNGPQTVTVELFVRSDYLVVPDDYPTIQAAIEYIAENGTVVVSAGTYTENLVFPGRDFILSSTDPEDPNVVASTIIDGNQSGSAVTFSGSETDACLLTGFTITNGSAKKGGGLLGQGTQAAVTYCTVTGNTSASYGGGLSSCDGAVSNCTVTGNSTDGSGGGLFNCNGSITNCTVTGNKSSYHGGGLYYSDAAVSNCTIASNKAYHGGGLNNCDGSITNCTITGNKSSYHGGGLYYSDAAISNCTITSNSANVDGGGLYKCGGSIRNCTIAGNTSAYRGGGLHCCDGSIRNCVVVSNIADSAGGGFYNCQGYIVNCTVVDNTAAIGGGLAYAGIITNCIFWGNSASDLGAQLNTASLPNYSCIQDWTGGGEGNITDDPMFVDTSLDDPLDWDLHLSTGSPCIDTGTNSPSGGLPAKDIDGISRPCDGDGDGVLIADIGAYEFVISSEEP